MKSGISILIYKVIMRIVYLTPFVEHTFSLTKKISSVIKSEKQYIVSFGQQSHQYLKDEMLIKILVQDNPSSSLLESTSHQLWNELVPVDIVHINPIFSNFGLFCLCVAKSMNKKVIGCGELNNNILIEKIGIELLEGFIVTDDLTKEIISALSARVYLLDFTSSTSLDSVYPFYQSIAGGLVENINT